MSLSIHVETDTGVIRISGRPLVRGDGVPVELTFTTTGEAVRRGVGATIILGFKATPGGSLLASCDTWTRGATDDDAYTGTLELTGEALDTALTGKTTLTTYAEVTWQETGDDLPTSSLAIAAAVRNDFNKNDDSPPVPSATFSERVFESFAAGSNVTLTFNDETGKGVISATGGGAWGGITGTLSNQTDLNTALAAKASTASLASHAGNTSNPHGVTKAQVGLSNVDNTADSAKPISTAMQAALDAKLSHLSLGKTLWVDAANGNNSTAARGTSKPYLTPEAAKAASLAGDVIYVRPGSYTVTESLAKNGVDWWLDLGASLSVPSGSNVRIFNDGDSAMSFSVGGYGRFATEGDEENTIFNMTHADSVLSVACDTVDALSVDSVIANMSGTLHLRARRVNAAAYDAFIASSGGRIYADADEIIAADNVAESVNGESSMSVIYVTARRIELLSGSTGLVSVGVGEAYITAEHVIGGSLGAVTFTEGRATLRIGTYELPAGTGSLLTISSGECTIEGGIYKTSSTKNGLNVSGGTLRIRNAIVDTSLNSSGNPLTKSGGIVVVDHSTLTTHASRNCITASTAQTVTSYGSTANTAVHANVTVQGRLDLDGAHTHAIADTSGLQAALDAKASLTSPHLQAVGTGDSANLFLGSTGSLSATGGSNTTLGYLAGEDLLTGNSNTLIGWSAGKNLTGVGDGNLSGGLNTFVGTDAGGNTTTGYANTFIGQKAGNSNTTGSGIVAIGKSTYANGNGGGNSVWIGKGAGEFASSTVGSSNTVVGYDAGTRLGSGATGNVYIGNSAGSRTGNTGSYNVAIGDVAAVNATGSQYVAIGRSAANSMTSGDGVIIGYRAGVDVTTGIRNTLIGTEAGGGLTTGNNNIFIGQYAGHGCVAATAGTFSAGGNNAAITDVYFGNGIRHTAPGAYIVNGTGGNGSNIAGGAVTIAGGRGTGTGVGGAVKISTAPAGSTGSTLNVLTDRVIVDEQGVVFIANATTVPSATPSGGGYLYVEGGALKYKGSSGTVTVIANA